MIQKVFDKKVTGILAYISLLFWLIAYLLGDVEEAKFHLNQGLVLAITEIVLGVVSSVVMLIPIIGLILGVVFSIVGIVLFVFAILGIVSAVKGEEKPLPIIGGIRILK